MLKKMVMSLSVVAAFGIALSAPASAAPPEHKNVQMNRNVHVNRNVSVRHNNMNVNRNVHVNRNVRVNRDVNVNRNVHVNRNVSTRYVIGRSYNGHIWYGRHRHFWHGRWYAYGVGPCWINIDGLWFWNELACPL